MKAYVAYLGTGAAANKILDPFQGLEINPEKLLEEGFDLVIWETQMEHSFPFLALNKKVNIKHRLEPSDPPTKDIKTMKIKPIDYINTLVDVSKLSGSVKTAADVLKSFIDCNVTEFTRNF